MTFYWDCGHTYVKVAVYHQGQFKIILRWATSFFATTAAVRNYWQKVAMKYQLSANNLFLVASVVPAKNAVIVKLAEQMKAKIAFVKRDLCTNYAQLVPPECGSDLLCAFSYALSQQPQRKMTLVGCGTMNWIIDINWQKIVHVSLSLGFQQQALVVQQLLQRNEPIRWEFQPTKNQLNTLNALSHGHLNAYVIFLNDHLAQFQPEVVWLTGGNAFFLQEHLAQQYVDAPMMVFAGMHQLAFAPKSLPYQVQQSAAWHNYLSFHQK